MSPLMNAPALIWKEIRFRKAGFLLAGLAVVVAVSLYVAFLTTAEAYRRETQRLMRDMGQNLRIIPKETPLDVFWSNGFSEHSMPEEYVQRFRKYTGFSYTHLTAVLQQRVQWRDMTAILTGVLPEVFPPDKSFQKPMTFTIEPGTIYLGSELARRTGAQPGDVVDLLGSPFTVAGCLAERGSEEDIRAYLHLHDLQPLLNLSGRINEIRALECLCIIESAPAEVDPLELARDQLKEILPEAQVVLLQGIAEIRQKQRATMERYLAFLMPCILVGCGVWIGVLAMMNVRERRNEIGVLRALGCRSRTIAALFLGKALAIGFLGAALGFVSGTLLALHFGPELFRITAKAITPQYDTLPRVLTAAPLLAALSSLLPVTLAVTQDPVEALRQD